MLGAVHRPPHAMGFFGPASAGPQNDRTSEQSGQPQEQPPHDFRVSTIGGGEALP
jgi:hypothetical protein